MSKYLAIGPAAMGYFALLGTISKLDLTTIEEISGSSAGAIIGMFLACNKTIDEITQWSLDLDLKELSKMNLKSFLKNYGLIPHDPIKKKFREFIGDPTFKQLSKKLYISSFCVNTSITEYFSVDTHPDMHVIDAVCMSMSVPFLFESVEYNNKLYVDGGTVERLPLKPFETKKEEDLVCIRTENKFPKVEIKDFKQFVTNLIIATIQKPLDHRGKLITVPLGSINIFDFLMTIDQKIQLFVIGQSVA